MVNATNFGLSDPNAIPTQYKIIALLLKSLGVEDAEPAVLSYLSDFIRSQYIQTMSSQGKADETE